MFNPSRDEVRQFFIETWRKHGASEILTPLEAIALGWISNHPEYHAELGGDEAALRDYSIDEGRTNPFLHLSMHLAIAEQLSIDQPPGIRSAYEKLVARRGGEHEAAHDVMECLGELLWTAQRSGAMTPPDELNAQYLDCLARRATRD